MDFYDLMSKSADDVGLQFSKERYEKFMIYMRLLQEWNEKINLTAIVEDEDVIKKHFIDSIKAFKREEFKKFEKKLLPKDINYSDIKGLRTEAEQKLNNIKPISVGQASRISGVSPADISVLLIYLEHNYNKQS